MTRALLILKYKLHTYDIINVREYRKYNQKWTIQRNLQHRVHNTKTKKKHNTICVGHHYAQTNTNNVNKTWSLIQTTGGKDEPEIVTDITTRDSEREDWLIDFWCLSPLSAIFQLYHGDQFLWWKKPEYPERTTDHGQATGKLDHLRLRVECTLFCNLQSRARTHAVLVIGLYELLGNYLTHWATRALRTWRHI
jgi:hypothetical protein